MVELRQLRHILALAKFRNFRLAAESVLISQPALSLSIRTAEEKLGQKLFERTGKILVPTVYCEILIEMGEKIFQDIDNMYREIGLISAKEASFLKISLAPYIHYSISEQLIKRFIKEFPGVSLDLVAAPWDSRIKMLKNKDIDIAVEAYAVDRERKIFNEPDLDTIEMRIPGIAYFCRAGHPLPKNATVSYLEIVKYNWAGEGGPPFYLHWLAEATGLITYKEIPDRKQQFFSLDYNSILTSVTSSDMISAGTPVFLNKYEKEGTIRYIDIAWKTPHPEPIGSVMVLKNRVLSGMIQRTIGIIRELMAGLTNN